MSNTAQRIHLILSRYSGSGTAATGPISQNVATIADEIDTLTAQLAEARAKVERYDSVISNAIAVLTIRAREAAKETP